ncbi:helicase MOV-10 [Zootoca vivipara]|uniref:helicase MOV-10 n=1 Tax=Zootoca vivipara TaxID=8524 RepID=UPI0015920A1B|nr:helicase MOV-10 [Zootoca vivipara]
MPKRTVRENKEIGEKFVQFLKDSRREEVSNKQQLTAIYNQEFRYRADIRGGNFSSVLYALWRFGLAGFRGDSVVFGRVKKKVKLTDQYRRPRYDAGDQPNQDQSPGAALPPCRSRAKDRAEFVSNKNGVDIVSRCDGENGKISLDVSPNEEKTIVIEVKNNGENEVKLLRFRKLRGCREFTFPYIPLPVELQPGETHEIRVRCLTEDYGYFTVTMVFEFISELTGSFIIGRFMSAVAHSKLEEQLAPSAPYKPYQAKLHKPQQVEIVDGIAPKNTLDYDLKQNIPLQYYNYPSDLKYQVDCMNKGHAPNDGTREKIAQLQSDLKAALQFDNYSKKFHLLLYLEEIQMEVDIRRYDKSDVCMEADKNKPFLVLQVPGVAENRPSVLRGDHILVTLAEDRGKHPIVQYKGYVHAVEWDKLKLGFSGRLTSRFIPKMKFDVNFTFCRLPLRVQHRAVDLAQERQLQNLLFPSFSLGQSLLTAGQPLILYDRNLESNKEQVKAVHQVVAGISRPAPYLIFGPPGTGKTVTMVEAIKQVLKRVEGSHVLACAPSNSASDLLCKLLLKHVEERNIYRMNASSRDYRSIPEDIKHVCNWDKTLESPVFPSKETLGNYRVIITTLITAGRLVYAQFPPGHFTHVFIDESGHAEEPQSLIAIAGILAMMDPRTNPKGGQLVLAGDPKQLGPILRSPLAIDHGLGLSLLERLMHQNSLYAKEDGSYNPQFVTKLLHNYRSHAAILKFPNDKFYDGELQEHGDHRITHSYCKWDELVKKGFPIIFHGVCGEDQREENSPSFFNTAEVKVLIDYLKKLLLENQGKKGMSLLSPKEFGVITPYRKQVEKIKKAIGLELKGVNDIKDLKVGCVEEFQGQERRVVLISTVRSSSNYFNIDEEFSIGFLQNPKRFNVAITRAKALLIIIGNPATLSKDQYWAEFLKYCKDNNAYRGYRYEAEENEEDEGLVEVLSSLSLNRQPEGNNFGESHIQQQVEPEWRSEH